MVDTLQVSFEEDGFATIQMMNGENRFQLSIIDEWNRALDKVLENKNTKGLLIKGMGRFFSNGIDLNWLGEQEGDSRRKFMDGLHRMLVRVLVFPVPTAALINGHAFGAGAFLALACDFRLMRPDRGWLCWPETAIGMRFGDNLLKVAK
ncbi:ECI3-like protein [Mya arenaria]|uniref:ECI3-like protein n=2 Tax=Mya arenaria TaxID=6604 RepID=A0ABY7EQQ5_MYAAR|nr:ECI3-like protein [Mya arenaria]